MADLAAAVKAELAKMRPYLERSGGAVTLLGIEDNVAKVELTLTRPRTSRLVASLQLAAGIERALTGAVPGLRGVEAVNLPPHTLAGWDQPGLAADAPGR